jgi:hypothetical protein
MRMKWIGRIVLVLLLVALGCTGGGETVITGLGNSNNLIGFDVLGRVADELAESPAIPAVSDDDLRAAFAAIRADALEGDPKAALVLLLVAGEQREEKD